MKKQKDTLVLTISIGEYYNELAKLTLPSIQSYAKKIGADFLNINEFNKYYITQKWNKFHIHELLNKYRRILYLDVDILIREDTPNLFEIVPENKLGMFNEGRYAPRFEYLEQASEYYGEPLKSWGGQFYNSGVMVISRMHKNIFKLPKGQDFVETDQPYINLRILNDNVQMFDLDYKFNRMDILDKHCGISRLDSYIVHYAGGPQSIQMDIIKKDIEQWKQDAPNYKYTRNILVTVTAGMGDQLCAEPAIRYTQKMYPDANMYVVTHFPRLFEHLSCPVMTYDQWNGINDAIVKMETCPDVGMSEHKMSHVLFHPTDFATMSMIKRAIPNHDKTIKLKLNAEDTASALKLLEGRNPEKPTVLVHAGKWWPSKTLPVEWWQKIVNKLSEKLTVVLIGKTIDEQQGYQPIECPKDGIDLRDLTTLGELMSLISLSRCVLTNDSSPIHIAGAFDNWIVTIPTCKHEDHILPYRNGTQYYKTKALRKRLLLDDLEVRHTEFHADTIDMIPPGKTMYDYIPEVDEVVQEVLEIYENNR
jgi:hypothetical protein